MTEQRQRRVRLYLDESGSVGKYRPNPSHANRFFGLVGVALCVEHVEPFGESLDRFRRDHIPDHEPIDDPCILHREEITAGRGRFAFLRDASRRSAFNEALLRLVDGAQFTVYGAVVDKETHQACGYRQVKDEYRYAMLGLLERHCPRMLARQRTGDVLAEGRGTKEDQGIKAAFRELATSGGGYLTKDQLRTLTSKELKVKGKDANVPGLQLADLLARDVTREVVHAYGKGDPPKGFGAELVKVIAPKYNTSRTGNINGYGRIWLR